MIISQNEGLAFVDLKIILKYTAELFLWENVWIRAKSEVNPLVSKENKIKNPAVTTLSQPLTNGCNFAAFHTLSTFVSCQATFEIRTIYRVKWTFTLSNQLYTERILHLLW